MSTIEWPTRMVAVPAIVDNKPIRLQGYADAVNDSCRALLFGELVKRTIGVTQHYISDLYRDGQAIDQYITGGNPPAFYWGPREWGTDFARVDDPILAPLILKGDSIERPPVHQQLYHVAMTNDRGMWYVTFTPMAIEGEGRDAHWVMP